MRLPNASVAHVERSKILEYLLNEDHREGGSKAHFFRQFGFRRGRWKQFAEALRNHALEHEVRHRAESNYGTRYVIEGALQTPDGRTPLIRTVWIVDDEATVPRLVTAYPIESNRMTQ
jgi:hypothetical protein